MKDNHGNALVASFAASSRTHSDPTSLPVTDSAVNANTAGSDVPVADADRELEVMQRLAEADTRLGEVLQQGLAEYEGLVLLRQPVEDDLGMSSPSGEAAASAEPAPTDHVRTTACVSPVSLVSGSTQAFISPIQPCFAGAELTHVDPVMEFFVSDGGSVPKDSCVYDMCLKIPEVAKYVSRISSSMLQRLLDEGPCIARDALSHCADHNARHPGSIRNFDIYIDGAIRASQRPGRKELSSTAPLRPPCSQQRPDKVSSSVPISQDSPRCLPSPRPPGVVLRQPGSLFTTPFVRPHFAPTRSKSDSDPFDVPPPSLAPPTGPTVPRVRSRTPPGSTSVASSASLGDDTGRGGVTFAETQVMAFLPSDSPDTESSHTWVVPSTGTGTSTGSARPRITPQAMHSLSQHLTEIRATQSAVSTEPTSRASIRIADSAASVALTQEVEAYARWNKWVATYLRLTCPLLQHPWTCTACAREAAAVHITSLTQLRKIMRGLARHRGLDPRISCEVAKSNGLPLVTDSWKLMIGRQHQRAAHDVLHQTVSERTWKDGYESVDNSVQWTRHVAAFPLYSIIPTPSGRPPSPNDNPPVIPWPGNLFIRTLTGRTISIHVQACCDVEYLKELIHQQEAIPAVQQSLAYRGTTLSDEEPIQVYNITLGSTLHLTLGF